MSTLPEQRMCALRVNNIMQPEQERCALSPLMRMLPVQDMEFTVQNNKLFMLQTRNGKRTGPAALKVAVDLVAEVRNCKTSAPEI
jgi:hypothetical protein